MQGNQRTLVPAAVGRAVLQGIPLTDWTKKQLVYEVIGLGTALTSDKDSGILRISEVFPGSPAAIAGLSAGLIIRKINLVEVQGKKSEQECLDIISSSNEAAVRLEVARSEETENRTVELKKGKFLTIG